MFPPHYPSYVVFMRISVLGQKPESTCFLNFLPEITSFSIFVVKLLLINNQTKHTHNSAEALWWQDGVFKSEAE